MTYFGFLARFLAVPLIIGLIITLWQERRGKSIPGLRNGRAVWMAIGLHALLAVVYTTPWDNYLVATGVWTYDPKLVSGLVLGWVPIEEYAFFVLETVLTGVCWWFLARRLIPAGEFRPRKNMRIAATAVLGVVWLASVYALISGWKPGTYLVLILVWALPAIAGQLAFGADILWHFRKLVAMTILPLFLYLSAADALAISAGTWTIDAAQSTGIFIGALPIEEGVFFLVTVMLIGFGLTLTLARASQERWAIWANPIERKRRGAKEELRISCRPAWRESPAPTLNREMRS